MKERGEGKTSRMVALSGSVQGQQATKGKSWERERERERERDVGSLELEEGD